ncbi:hypothetical protein K501DRAFT_321796 [Backusella circina FSU 941]|nr:hypothetical protein K501DRAFT_321796 [Backusella circina FSU 941]
MLPSLGLFKSLPCPLYPSCNRNPCLFSHTIQPPKPKPKPQPLKKPDPINKRKREEEDLANKRQRPEQSKKPSSSLAGKSKLIPTSSTAKQTISERKPVVDQRDQIDLTRSKQRVAHKATFKATGPPLISPNARSVIPLKVRQTIATKIYEQFERIYLPLQQPDVATEHAKRQEEDILSKITNLAGYKQLATSTLVHLKKRPVSTGEKDIGLDGEWVDPATVKDTLAELKAKAEKCICSLEQLKQLEYPLPDLFTNTVSTEDMVMGRVGEEHDCDRCKSRYIIKDILDNKDAVACDYHPLRLMMTKRFGEKQRLHPCCSEPGDSKGCTKGAHVYKDTRLDVMHAKIPFVQAPSVDASVSKCKLVALDCEMGYTTGGMELIRLTAVDEGMNVLVDELVLPMNMIIDLNSAYSGVNTLEGAKHDLASLRDELFKHIDRDTILVGHGLENDMNALRIVHTRIIDTVALYPHSAGLPFRNSLRQLASRHLKKFIQTGSDGHDSLEDARTCIELLEAYKL